MALVGRAGWLILVTANRRESFGNRIERICEALGELARRDDVQIVYPVHRNPNVLEPVSQRLGAVSNIVLLPPLGYRDFVDLMRRSTLLLTDSGGIQEEAPSLGKPVLMMRKPPSGRRRSRRGRSGSSASIRSAFASRQNVCSTTPSNIAAWLGSTTRTEMVAPPSG